MGGCGWQWGLAPGEVSHRCTCKVQFTCGCLPPWPCGAPHLELEGVHPSDPQGLGSIACKMGRQHTRFSCLENVPPRGTRWGRLEAQLCCRRVGRVCWGVGGAWTQGE